MSPLQEMMFGQIAALISGASVKEVEIALRDILSKMQPADRERVVSAFRLIADRERHS